MAATPLAGQPASATTGTATTGTATTGAASAVTAPAAPRPGRATLAEPCVLLKLGEMILKGRNRQQFERLLSKTT